MQANNPVKALYTMEETVATLEEHEEAGVMATLVGNQPHLIT